MILENMPNKKLCTCVSLLILIQVSILNAQFMGVPRSQNFGPVPSSNSNFGHQRRSQGSVSVRKYTNMLSSKFSDQANNYVMKKQAPIYLQKKLSMTPQHPPMAPAHYTGVIRGPHVNGIRAANKLGAHAPLNNYQQPILHQQNQYNPNGMNSYYLQANTHNSAIDPQFEARAQLMAFHNRERVPNHKLGLSRADHGYMQDGKFRFQHDNESGNSRTPIKDKLLREGSFHLDANMKGKNKNQYSNDDLAKKMRDKNWLLEKTNSSKQAETDPHDIFKDLNLEIQPTFELEKNLNANKKRISADGVKALDYINLDDLLNDHINLNEFLKHDDLVDNLIRDDEKI